MGRDREFDEILKRKISETLGEPVQEGVDADDLMFDLGLRYLRMAAAEKKKKAGEKADPLSLWAEGAASKRALTAYVQAVTDRGSPDYIPPADRIAVFDLDGTLFCESDPTWFDFMLYRYRIEEDPAYRDRATQHEKKIASDVDALIETGEAPPGLEIEVGNCLSGAFAGMRVSDFARYIRDFAEKPAPCYEGMKIGEAFYQPMVQVIDYLRDRGFTVYVCSGSDQMVVRGIVEGGLILAARYVIGTEERISARDQGAAQGEHYVFKSGDELVLSGSITGKNLKMRKVSMVAQQVGQCPVLCFGNSEGDISITNYVMSNDRYRAAAFFVCCDDEIRESGSPQKAEKILRLCQDNGWIPISMKRDWLTVFGEGVRKKQKAGASPDP